ncbi:flavin monoamine oxidase family protein [Spongiimicrobium salis]|uniref:flavin monoamine oxidase family protein n=1 Tax=Spongiimicrobium salis TaxID=1667022 RepID=UPI00374CD82E
MQKTHSKYIIVGAGLSGLTAGYTLYNQNERDFTILEARNRIGGRIHTHQGIDLGATWFQNYHEHLVDLANTLNINSFPQYAKGTGILTYSPTAPAHYFESDPNGPSAYRFAGGSISLLNRLAEPLEKNMVLGAVVHAITATSTGVSITTQEQHYTAEKVIVTLPPQLASCIAYTPLLPPSLQYAMENTHTWMGNAIKVGLTFEQAFWREKGYSGIIMGQVGPTTELYDHSNALDTSFALMGFVNEQMRYENPEKRKELILGHLEEHFGKEVRQYHSYEEKDWSEDPFTFPEKFKGTYHMPQYGNPVFQSPYFNEKLWFCGAETSPIHGGYMDGAVYSGRSVVKKLLATD